MSSVPAERERKDTEGRAACQPLFRFFFEESFAGPPSRTGRMPRLDIDRSRKSHFPNGLRFMAHFLTESCFDWPTPQETVAALRTGSDTRSSARPNRRQAGAIECVELANPRRRRRAPRTALCSRRLAIDSGPKNNAKREKGKSSKAEWLGWNSRQDGGRLVERSEPFPSGLFASGGGDAPKGITREPEVFHLALLVSPLRRRGTIPRVRGFLAVTGMILNYLSLPPMARARPATREPPVVPRSTRPHREASRGPRGTPCVLR